jgi:antitoxin MazE
MHVRIVKWGNSLAVRIPKHITKEAKLKHGDSLEINAIAEGEIALRRVSRLPTLAQLVSQISPENRYGEISVGAEIGREVVEW